MINVFGIVGWSGSGKTDLVCRLINFFGEKMIKVSSIKHTHHEFNIDKEGKDSYKHINAGSNEVLIYNSKRWALISNFQKKDVEISEMINKFHCKTDIILLEGLKQSKYPKIEVVRFDIKKPLLFKKDRNIKAVVYDKKDKELDDISIPCFPFENTNKIGNFIKNYFQL